MQKTISINILDFNFIPDTQEVHNCYKIINTATGKDDKLHDIFELHYLELRKFTKSYSQITSALDRWTTFLTKADKLDKNHVPAEQGCDPAIVKAITAVDRMFNEEERQVYEVRMQSLADVESKIASAEEKGREAGREEGREENQKQTVINAYRAGLDVETISKISGLDQDTVGNIIKTIG